MANYTTINKPNLHFNVKAYTGNGTDNNATQSINMGLQPDLCWIKGRNSAQENHLFDSVRGSNLRLVSNSNQAEADKSDRFNGITSTGFDLVQDDAGTNLNNNTYVSWGWKANGSGSANTDGSINSTVSSNQTAGFSIVKFTGTGSAGTIGHGLNKIPTMIWTKNLDSSGGSAEHWSVYHKSITAGYQVYLNLTNTQNNASEEYNATRPTSSVFSVGASSGRTNKSGEEHISFCFTEIPGYSKMGFYKGLRPFVFTGFKPKFVLLKSFTSITENWWILDDTRDSVTGNPRNDALSPSVNNTEYVNSTGWDTDFVSNGFKIRGNQSGINYAGTYYIYYAVADEPLVGTNNIPNTAG